MAATAAESQPTTRDLRKEPIADLLAKVERRLDVRLDQAMVVRKRRTVGARTDRRTWVRIEARPLARIQAQGQPPNGIEAAELLTGIAKPAWFNAVVWLDPPGAAMWRADEVELVASQPLRQGGKLSAALELPNLWWDTLNRSLDNLAAQHTRRIATPDTQTITQELVSATINRAFPNTVDTTVTDEPWVPAHADMLWSNVTAPECWIIDWEDHGLAPRGLDSATLWVSSLGLPALAERVHEYRRADLETRSGRLMALFHCAKILNDTGNVGTSIYKPASSLAATLVAELAR